MASSSSAPSLLESLPLHLLEEICEHLAAVEAKKRSLFALSQTSKTCCLATARMRLNTVRMFVDDDDKLRRDVEEWVSILQERNASGYVRRLKIFGNMSHINGRLPGDARIERSDCESKEGSGRDDDTWSTGSQDDFWVTPGLPIEFDPSESVPTEEEKKRADLAWRPLVALIPTLRGLTDVIYACKNQMPGSFLSAIHQHQSKLRLHMHSFSLRSLYQDQSKLHDIDSDEYALATSPSLSSIFVDDAPQGYDTFGHVSFNREAVLSMAAGSAPNLKFISFRGTNVGASWDLLQALQQPRPVWPGFFHHSQENANETRTSSIETLVLGRGQRLTPKTVNTWSQHIDFNKLQSLFIVAYNVSIDSLRTLHSIASNDGFKSLRALALSPDPWNPADTNNQHLQVDHQLAQFLNMLQPLEHLELLRYFADETFDSVLQIHGHSLRKVRLIPARETGQSDEDIKPYVLSRHWIQARCQACPSLREAELLVPRTMGDEDEPRIYDALSTLPRLERLSLVLDCSNIVAARDNRNNEEYGDQFPACPVEVSPKHVRDAFVNAAIDGTLAASICDRISSSSRHSPLQKIRLQILGAGNFGNKLVDEDFHLVVSWLGRSWRWTRDARQGHEQESSLREVIVKKRREAGKELAEGLDPFYAAVLGDIWPNKTGSWMNEWKSFPLWNAR